MNKEQDYASDSDESDEDFRPDQAGESAASEEESGGSGNEEEHAGEGEAATKPKNVRRSKKLTKKTSKKKTAKSEDSDESDEDETVNNAAEARRSTRQCDESLANGRGKQHEKNVLESDEEDKTRTSALWADFLNDVGPSTKVVNKSVSEEKPSSSRNGKDNASKTIEKLSNGQAGNTRTKEEPKKVTVTEVLEFAGEEVRVQREIDASSIKENKATATAAPKLQPFGRIMPGAGIKRPAAATGSSAGGLGSILNQIGKKKKISVLEKSQMDWKSFKQDEGIDEQLQTFNKGKDGYLERQDFLQRTDLRQFEIEKNMRQTTRRPF